MEVFGINYTPVQGGRSFMPDTKEKERGNQKTSQKRKEGS